MYKVRTIGRLYMEIVWFEYSSIELFKKNISKSKYTEALKEQINSIITLHMAKYGKRQFNSKTSFPQVV